MFIDHGSCFNGGQWTFPDLALHGAYHRNYVYQGVTGWESFEPTLTKAEGIGFLDVWRFAQRIPPEWYGHDSEGLSQLIETVYERRRQIRSRVDGVLEAGDRVEDEAEGRIRRLVSDFVGIFDPRTDEQLAEVVGSRSGGASRSADYAGEQAKRQLGSQHLVANVK